MSDLRLSGIAIALSIDAVVLIALVLFIIPHLCRDAMAWNRSRRESSQSSSSSGDRAA